MTQDISLSSCIISESNPFRRESPRPLDLRQPGYDERFDWTTLFYDVYRSGDHVVFQGPPLLNLLKPLKEYDLFKRALRPLLGSGRHISRDRRGEIWLKSQDNHIALTGPLGDFEVVVQPDMSDMFAGKRVITTISKDNHIRWIKDWVQYYVRGHGADAVLLYDNGSTLYTASELQSSLRQAFPGILIAVNSWVFPFGPDGGDTDDGRYMPWDSDYCQIGSMQHARFRFLAKAKSILNVDIDEIVLGNDGQSIFEATESNPLHFTKFEGKWIGTSAHHPVTLDQRRHGDFVLADPKDEEDCPPKWCLVPNARHKYDWSWTHHNLFGAKANAVISSDFTYRHMRSISTDWKYQRSQKEGTDPQLCVKDQALHDAFKRTNLLIDPT